MSRNPSEKDNKKVILSFPEPTTWTFLTYVEDGVDVIDEWYKAQTFEARMAFDKVLKANVKIKDHQHWTGYRHKLKGKKRKIFEIEFSADKRANRVLCIFDGVKRAVLLIGCYHKNNLWTPSGAPDIAAKRAEKVMNGTAKLNIRQIRNDL
jgi:hypothetical protein